MKNSYVVNIESRDNEFEVVASSISIIEKHFKDLKSVELVEKDVLVLD